jgi:Protein of unknown function (DUF3667)
MFDHSDRNCRNCGAAFTSEQSYCGRCGQKAGVQRLTLHEISHDLLHVFVHLDRSALTLVGLLLVRPGRVARDYVEGKRKRYFGPFGFLFVVVAAATAVVSLTGFHAVFVPNANRVADFVQRHINMAMFAEVPVLAAFSRLLDTRGSFNVAEHLVLAAYTSSMRVLFATVIAMPVWAALHPTDTAARYLYLVYLPIFPMYFGFATSQFYPGSRLWSWCRGVLAAILTWVATQSLATLVASLWS